MKIFGKINIAACGSYLPTKRQSVSKAIISGLYDERDYQDTKYKSISIEKNKYPAIMSLLSSKKCFLNSVITPEDVNIITYSGIHRHGHKALWSPASYLQKKLGLKNAIPYSLIQGCNSQMLSVQLVASQLLADEDMQSALSVSADRFDNSNFNRWNSDYGIVYGDAAASVLLTKKEGIAKIININTVTAPDMEELHRSEREMPENDIISPSNEYNIRESKKNFLKKYGVMFLKKRTKKSLSKLHAMMFSESGIQPSDVKFYIMPNLGEKLLHENYYPIFSHAKENSLWDFGKLIGHLGASDCIVGLSYVLENKMVKSGDILFLLGAGVGFTWTGILLQIN